MSHLLILILLLSILGCAHPQADNWERQAYGTTLQSCLKRSHYDHVTLTSTEYAETEKYRSEVDPDLDDKKAIQAIYDRKRETIRLKCESEAMGAGQRARSGPAVSLPVVFVAPLY